MVTTRRSSEMSATYETRTTGSVGLLDRPETNEEVNFVMGSSRKIGSAGSSG